MSALTELQRVEMGEARCYVRSAASDGDPDSSNAWGQLLVPLASRSRAILEMMYRSGGAPTSLLVTDRILDVYDAAN